MNINAVLQNASAVIKADQSLHHTTSVTEANMDQVHNDLSLKLQTTCKFVTLPPIKSSITDFPPMKFAKMGPLTLRNNFWMNYLDI
jgi:hypothetical protein